METTLYGITNCDTVKRARTWLKTMGIDYQLHDYKKLGCSTDQARQFLDHFGMDAVLNRRGTTWRKLSDDQKSDLTEDSVIFIDVGAPLAYQAAYSAAEKRLAGRI